MKKKFKNKLLNYHKDHKDDPQSGHVLEAISMLQKFLKDSNLDFKGITITIDELGKHVEYAGSNQRDGDIYILQELAEHCVKESEIPVFFNVMLHQAIEFYAKDLDKETVDWTVNFDETLKEPTVLPTTVPTLLINGSEGIAVGMATKIPPHNLCELITGLKSLLLNPDITCLLYTSPSPRD